MKEKEKQITCPKCNSDNVAKSRKPKFSVGYILLFFGIPIAKYQDKYHCFECYDDFKPIEKKSTDIN